MTMTREETKLMDQRETELTAEERDYLEDTMLYFEQRHKENGGRVLTDDRAAHLEAALVRYILAAKPVDPDDIVATDATHRLVLNKVKELGGVYAPDGEGLTYRFPTAEANNQYNDWIVAESIRMQRESFS
jgi:hypothetical protein